MDIYRDGKRTLHEQFKHQNHGPHELKPIYVQEGLPPIYFGVINIENKRKGRVENHMTVN